jgi:arylsulfatase A-like enzyme
MFVKSLLNSYNIKEGKMEKLNVVFIVIDCLRWDHTSMANYGRPTTPFIKNLSEKGLLCTNAYAAAPWTYPSVISLLTGYYPSNHGGIYVSNPRHFIKSGLPNKPKSNVLYLSEILKNFNYQILFATDIYAAAVAINNRELCSLPYKKGKLNPLALLNKNLIDYKKNFFMYLQLGNPHIPIQIPKSFDSIFGDIENLPNLSNWSYESGNTDHPEFLNYRENRIKLYDATIRYADFILEKLVDEIQEKSGNETIFIITADHGEELWDHAQLEKKFFWDPRKQWGIGHGHNLFQEIIKVPLVLYGENVRHLIKRENVSLVDVFPTILELLGLNEIACDGQSLFSDKRRDFILSEGTAYGYEKKSVIQENRKLIVSEGDSVSLLFDLEKDPLEKQPIKDSSLEKKLANLISMRQKVSPKTNELKITQDMKKRLEELGYF